MWIWTFLWILSHVCTATLLMPYLDFHVNVNTKILVILLWCHTLICMDYETFRLNYKTLRWIWSHFYFNHNFSKVHITWLILECCEISVKKGGFSKKKKHHPQFPYEFIRDMYKYYWYACNQIRKPRKKNWFWSLIYL